MSLASKNVRSATELARRMTALGYEVNKTLIKYGEVRLMFYGGPYISWVTFFQVAATGYWTFCPRESTLSDNGWRTGSWITSSLHNSCDDDGAIFAWASSYLTNIKPNANPQEQQPLCL